MKIQTIARYIPPLLAASCTAAAFFHTSADATILGRYSLDYSVLLILFVSLTGVLWSIASHRDAYRRLSSKLTGNLVSVVITAVLAVPAALWWWANRAAMPVSPGVIACIGIAALSVALLALSRERPSSVLLKVGLVAISLMLAILLLEIAFRIKAHADDRNVFDRINERKRPLGTDREVTLGQFIMPSRNHSIVYELIPDLRFRFKGAPVTVNSVGFRSREVEASKPPGVVRILGLGDSIMFGWGIHDEETYLAVLERKLNRRFPSASWETVNTAVPGYNTVMEVAVLKEKGLRYEPDLVVIHYVSNDLELPDFIRQQQDYFTLRKSFLADFVKSVRLQVDPGFGRALAAAPFDSEQRRFVSDPELVPPEYRDMVGLEAYRAAMHELSALSERYGFEVVVVTHVGLQDFVKELCIELGFPMVEAYYRWRRYVSDNAIKNPDDLWKVTPRDAHPSALGHTIIAEAIVEWGEKNGVFESLVDDCRGRSGGKISF